MPFRDTILPIASSRTLGQVTLLALAMGGYSFLPVLKEYSSFQNIGDIPSDMHAALSLILGCLLVFRTNAAYSRWWEARTLWGSLVNVCRNLSIKLTTYVHPSVPDAEYLQMKISDFPVQLKDNLRLQRPKRGGTNDFTSEVSHPPLSTATDIFKWLTAQKRDGKIDGDELRVIDLELAKLMEICGACERIARTPFVRSYRTFMRQCIVLFLLSFPWGVAQDFQWWTIPITIIIAYFMLGMEIVAEHVEEPFGFDEDDLDLDGLCETIDQSVRYVFNNRNQQA